MKYALNDYFVNFCSDRSRDTSFQAKKIIFLLNLQLYFSRSQQRCGYLEADIELTQNDLSSAMETKQKLEELIKRMKTEEEQLQELNYALREKVNSKLNLKSYRQVRCTSFWNHML